MAIRLMPGRLAVSLRHTLTNEGIWPVELAPLKIGCFASSGLVAYLRELTLFVKRFAAQMDCTDPDLGCNVEVYCNDRFVEMETLAPLTMLGSCRVPDRIVLRLRNSHVPFTVF